MRLEDITDSSGNQYTNLVIYDEQYAVVGWDLTREEPYLYSRFEHPSDRWSIRFYLKEIPPRPAPEPKRKRKLSDLGLRRPK